MYVCIYTYIHSFIKKQLRKEDLIPAYKKLKLYQRKRISAYKYNVIWVLIKACTV